MADAPKQSGDVIVGTVGEHAQGVAVGKNIIQIGTLVIPTIPVLAVLGLLLVAAVALGSQLLGPAKMTGLFNVAVAEFGQVDAAGHVRPSDDGKRLSEWVFNGLRQEFDSLPLDVRQQFQPQVWHDSLPITQKRASIGVIPGDTEAERAAAAEQLARSIGADVVIYGNLSGAANPASFVPEFYVAPLRGEAEQIVGPYGLGAPIPVQLPINLSEDRQAARALNLKLSVRTSALSRLTIGLMYDLGGSTEQALTIFDGMEGESDWNEREGKEILYYFIGRENLFLEHDQEAQQAFERAVEINPNYARAHIGLGSVYYYRAQRTLPPEQRLQTGDLGQAIAEYQKALELAPQSPETQIDAKAHLALGTAYRLQGEAYLHAEDHDSANRLFDQTLAEITQTVGPLRDGGQFRLLAQAYLTMAAAYHQQAYIRRTQGDAASSKTLYQQAIDTYSKCIEQGQMSAFDTILTETIIAGQCQPSKQAAEQDLASLEGGTP